MSFLPILIAGFAGGAIRGIFGFIKYQYSYKNVGFNARYFFLMIFLSGIIGLAAAYLIAGNEVFALIVGYAGGDFIENLYKTIIKKESIYEQNLKDIKIRKE
jgi:hypothetical protein